MRALPADSLEYFGDTAVGNTASPAAAGAVFGRAAVVREVGAAAAGAVFVGTVVGVAVLASGPHSAFRKSFYFVPLIVPAA